MEFKDFLHPRKENKQERTPESVLRKVILTFLKDFKEGDREYVCDYVEGRWLTPDEKSETYQIIKEWWKKSFDANFDDISKRNQILNNLEVSQETDLQEKYLENARFRVDAQENEELKKMFIKKFPDQIQGIELLFGMTQILETQVRLKKSKNEKRLTDAQADLVSVTEYFFTLINFIQTNQNDKDFLRLFWGVLEEVASSAGLQAEYVIMKSGILSHIAGHQIAEKIGLRPHSSNPIDDALYGIDEYGKRGEILQYKSKAKLAIVRGEVDSAKRKPAFGVFEQMNGLRVYNDFREKVKKTCARKGISQQVYYLIDVPYNKYDHITGGLDKVLLEEIDKNMVEDVDTVIAREVVAKETILRDEITEGTKEHFQKMGKNFNENVHPYLLTSEEYDVLLRQCVIQNIKYIPNKDKALLFGYAFKGEVVQELDQALFELWGKIPDAPSFDNKEAVGDYLFRRYLRDVDYGWKKRDMAGGTGVSGGK